jgi:hypothetical protein
MLQINVTLALVGALAILLAIIGYQFWKKSRVSPEERELRRRTQLAAHGKMGDATLLDVQDGILLYAYLVRGVEYTASQDITHIVPAMPADLSTLGAVAVKYDPKNPANSIVVAEQWSGLRVKSPRA